MNGVQDLVKSAWYDIAVVFAGGGFGALSRWILSIYIQNKFSLVLFPISTLIVNIIGSFIIGFIMGATVVHGVFSREQRLLLATGYTGSLTTFSTFEYETFRIMSYSYSLAFLNVAMSIILGLVFVYLGYVVADIVYG